MGLLDMASYRKDGISRSVGGFWAAYALMFLLLDVSRAEGG